MRGEIVSEKDRKKESLSCRVEGGIPVYEYKENKMQYFDCYIPNTNPIRISNEMINNSDNKIKKNNEKVKDIFYLNGPDLINPKYMVAYDLDKLKEAYLSEDGVVDSKGRRFNEVRKYFGTHDWFAESAVMALRDCNSHFYINLLSNCDLLVKYYYLLGTEAPDVNRDVNPAQEIVLVDNSNRIYGTDSLYGYNKYGRIGNSPFTHYVYFDDNDNRIENRDALRGSEWAFNLANGALQDKEYEKAAFFMGALCHYIADAGGYPHLYQNPFNATNLMGTTISSTTLSFWAKISCLTIKPERFRSSTDFFDLDVTKSNFLKYNPMINGLDAALLTAKQVNKYKNYLHDTWGKKGDLWPIERRECLNWNHSTWSKLNEEQREYFKTIKYTIDIAIYSCAAAINKLLNDNYL